MDSEQHPKALVIARTKDKAILFIYLKELAYPFSTFLLVVEKSVVKLAVELIGTMALYQNSVLRKHLASQDAEAVKAAYATYSAYFLNKEIQENIRNSKEEQFQEGFLRELFVNVLGYTINPEPQFNLTTELKNIKDAKKTDGAILTTKGHYPLSEKEKEKENPLSDTETLTALAVIELKGTDTKDLDKVNDQAFNYKNNQPDCVYVITSNFEKLRFFIHNAVEHEEFNLFTLTEDRFALLWLFLQKDNLLGGIPAKVKEESLLQEDKITKALYADYSAFKNDLWNDMVQRNAQHDQLLLYKKSQKLLDRFLFIFFAEDKGLLPPNSISSIVEQWADLKDRDAYSPLYDRFQKYFGYMNDGFKGKFFEIHAYNGGLFKADELLDGLLIDDELLKKHCLKLTKYDFADEVDTNILGHIFEHSLNDIENVRAQLAGEEVDKSKTKRKKDGVFYTPKYITKYIVDNTVGKLCEEKKAELEIDDEEFAKDRKGRKKATILKLDAQLKQYREWLLQLTICDPACGSGAFLNQALEFLMAEHRYVDELEAQLFEGSIVFQDVENHILENNIYGVDINEESVEIARLSLWLRTAQKGRKLTSLSSNIKCGNSLIDDPEVAGNLAFNWQKEFPTVFHEKEKHAYHITTATHDSRTSQRMVDHKVRQKRDNGTRPYPEAIWLEPEDELHITQTVAEIVKKDGLNVLAFNICGDHLHLLLVCEEQEVPKIVGKIKAVSAKRYNRHKGKTDTSSSTPTPTLTTRGHVPLSDTPSDTRSDTRTEKEGEKSVPLWTQKFGCKEITDHQQLENTVHYIEHNRAKHELPANKTLQKCIDSMLCGYDEVFATEYKGGFDVVIGNPPYVSSKGENFEDDIKAFLTQQYNTAAYQIDLYMLFIERGLSLQNEEGITSFIVPNTWLNNLSLEPVRKFLLTNAKFHEVISMATGTFESASVDTVITTFSRCLETESVKLLRCMNSEFQFVGTAQQNHWLDEKGFVINVHLDEKSERLLKKLEKNSTIVKDFTESVRGVGVYHKRKGHTKEFIASDPFQTTSKVDDSFVPYLRGKNLQRWHLTWNDDSFISYGDWLAEPREPRYFSGERILIRKILSDRIIAAYLDHQFVVDQQVYTVMFTDKVEFTLKSLLGVLSSRLMTYYFKMKYSEFDDLFPQIKLDHIKSLPISNQLCEVDNVLDKLVSEALLHVAELYNASNGFITLLQSKFDLPKPSTKLKNWPSLDFKGFLAELKKAMKKNTTTRGHVPLSLEEEAEWMEYFNKKKAEANALQTEIDRVDKEIDGMVYELYGLSEEEIGIVEGS